MPDYNMKVTIGGQPLKRVDREIEFNVSNSEEGDTLYGVFTTKENKEYVPYTLCEVEYLDKKYHMVVDADEKIQVNKDVVIHHLSLKSAIHYFDGFIPPSRTFTKVEDGKLLTIKEVLEIYAETTEQGRKLFTFDDLDVYQQRFVDVEYDGENLSTILKDIFRRIDAFPMVKPEGNQLKLYPRFIGEFKGDEPIEIQPKAKRSQIDTVGYATRVMANLKNAVYEDGKGTWFPSKKGSITPRTKDLIYSQSSARYILDNDIVWIFQSIVKDAVAFTDDPESENAQELFIDLDISERVIPRELFETYPDPATTFDMSSDNQSNLVPYDIGDNTVGELWRSAEGIFQQDRSNLINAINKHFEDNFGEISAKIMEDYPNAGLIELNTKPIEELAMRFRYLSNRDIAYTIEKQDVKDALLITMLSNQRSSSVEMRQHKKALSRLANRLAERDRNYTNYFKSNQKPPEIGEWTEDGYIVTKAKYLYAPHKTKCEWHMNKNFSNIDAQTGISRNPEPFTITGKRIQTNTQTHEYIEISEALKDSDSYLTEFGRKVALNVLNFSENYNKPIEDSYYYIKDTLPPPPPLFNVPLPGGGSNVITIHNHFKDPTLAYKGVRKNDFSVFGTWQRQNIRYTDFDGEVQRFTFNHGNGFEYNEDVNQEELRFPEVEQEFGDSILELPDIDIRLDPNASLAHTHNIHIVTDNARKIINTGGFSELNNLHQELEDSSLKVYHRNSPYNLTDLYIGEEDTEDSNVVLDFVDRSLQVIKSKPYKYWGLVKGDIILFAYNHDDAISRVFHFNFSKKRLMIGIVFQLWIGFLEQKYEIPNAQISFFQSSFNLESQEIEQDYDIQGNIEIYQSVYNLEANEVVQNYSMEAFVYATQTLDGEIHQNYYIPNANIKVIKTLEFDSGTIEQGYNLTGNISYFKAVYDLQAQTINQSYILSGNIDVKRLNFDMTANEITQNYNVQGENEIEMTEKVWSSTMPQTEDFVRTYTVTNPGAPCPSISTITNWLTSNENPEEYSEGTVCKVEVSHPSENCGNYYYQVVKQTTTI